MLFKIVIRVSGVVEKLVTILLIIRMVMIMVYILKMLRMIFMMVISIIMIDQIFRKKKTCVNYATMYNAHLSFSTLLVQHEKEVMWWYHKIRFGTILGLFFWNYLTITPNITFTLHIMALITSHNTEYWLSTKSQY